MPPTNYIWMKTNLRNELIGIYEWYEGKWHRIHIDGGEYYTKEEIDTLLVYTEQEIIRKITTGEYDICDITIDEELSLDSENPVQNKVITAALEKKLNKTDNIPIEDLIEILN